VGLLCGGNRRPLKAASGTVPETTFWAQGAGAWGDIDAAHLAGYLAAQSCPRNLRTAVAASFGGPDVNRSIVFPGFVGTATADNSASTAQIFGELGYCVVVGQIALEPFGGLAFVHLKTDSFAEIGGSGFGSGLLSGSDHSENIGYSTLGGRAATNFNLPDDKILTLRASAAWMHAFDAVTSTAALTFQSTGAPFTIGGVPLAWDSALIEGGLELHLNPQTKLGLSFSSQFGNNVQDNAVQGNLTWRF
jgi:outer membrane autotransporter protein